MAGKSPAAEQPANRGVPVTMSVREVCDALGISRATLYRRPYRFTRSVEGGRRRYFADDLRLVLTLNTVTPEADRS